MFFRIIIYIDNSRRVVSSGHLLRYTSLALEALTVGPLRCLAALGEALACVGFGEAMLGAVRKVTPFALPDQGGHSRAAPLDAAPGHESPLAPLCLCFSPFGVVHLCLWSRKARQQGELKG